MTRMIGLALLIASSFGCQGSSWPPDNIPPAEAGPTHELTVKPSPTSATPGQKTFKVMVPMSASLDSKYPSFVQNGEDVLVIFHYLPKAVASQIEYFTKVDMAFRGKSSVPDGYVVVGNWRGKVEQQKDPIARTWSLSYQLWDGTAYFSAHLSFAKDNPDSEKRARAVFNSAIRTLKGV